MKEVREKIAGVEFVTQVVEIDAGYLLLRLAEEGYITTSGADKATRKVHVAQGSEFAKSRRRNAYLMFFNISALIVNALLWLAFLI